MIDLYALRWSWCRETGAGNVGRQGEPVGQCAVTALLVQDLFGGDLVRAEVALPGRERESHYWNRIPNMGDLDFTRAQYSEADRVWIPTGSVVLRSRLLEGERAIAARTPERYALLKQRYDEMTASGSDPRLSAPEEDW